MPSVKSELRSLVTPEGATILDISKDELTTLNSTGGYVWMRLRKGDEVEKIVADLAEETSQDPSAIRDDVHEFIEQLAEKHLVIR
jgi:hypothetical protein